MSVRSFRSVFMVGGVAGAALSCYLVSLRVASERAALEDAETQIVLAQRDIRLLQTEIGTRGRLAQLERWNVKVLALSAPSADQFVADGFTLARLTQPETKPAVEAPVVYASAPSEPQPSVLKTDDASVEAQPRLLHQTSLSTLPKPAPRKLVVASPEEVSAAIKAKAEATPAKKPAASAKADSKAKPAAAKAKVSPSPAKPRPAEVKVAKADPLAPLPKPRKATASDKKTMASATAKDSSKTR